MLRRFSTILLLLAALALPLGAGVARSFASELPANSLGAGAEPSEEEQLEEEANQNAKGEKSSGPSAIVIVAIVGGVILIGSAAFIVRDARKVAPIPETAPTGGKGMTAEARAAALRRRREKEKAARRQRKRNR
jgi:hypothetical protein